MSPGQAPVRSCCGSRHFGAVCPDGLVRCCLCGERVTVADLSRDPDTGSLQDVCSPCAQKGL